MLIRDNVEIIVVSLFLLKKIQKQIFPLTLHLNSVLSKENMTYIFCALSFQWVQWDLSVLMGAATCPVQANLRTAGCCRGHLPLAVSVRVWRLEEAGGLREAKMFHTCLPPTAPSSSTEQRPLTSLDFLTSLIPTQTECNVEKRSPIPKSMQESFTRCL